MKGQLIFFGLIGVFCTGISAIDINCHDRSNIKLKHLQTCCKHPEGRNEITEKCANKTGILKLPKQNDESFVALSPEAAIIHRCFSECLLVENNLWIDGQLNMDNVRKHIKDKVADEEYVKEMAAAIDLCHSIAIKKRAEIMEKVQTSPNDKCDPLPGAILACTITQFFKNCPANRWTNNDECNNSREFLNKCEMKLFAPAGSN